MFAPTCAICYQVSMIPVIMRNDPSLAVRVTERDTPGCDARREESRSSEEGHAAVARNEVGRSGPRPR